jgi:acetylornithine deacetylase/succinyl-diaminopimelate desuccinylase-like protein
LTPNAALTPVFEYIEAHRQGFVDELLAYLRQPSISTQDVGVEECAAMLRGIMAGCGLEARVLPTAGKPVVFGERRVHPELPTVLIYGHYDVQPVDPLDAWVSPPFEPSIRNGRIYARGSGDNKGQHLAQLLALRAYLETVGELPVNVKVLVEGEEESSSPNLASFARDHRDLLAADVVYVSDGPVHESGRPVLVLGVRGILYIELQAGGARSDMHSGNRGGVVPNPAWQLVELLATMRDAQGHVLIEGFYDAVRRPTSAEREAIAHLPLDLPAVLKELGIARLPPPDGLGYYERLMLQPTLNICGFHSGYGGAGKKTVIPSTAAVKMDMRLVPDQDPDDIFSKFVRHVEQRAPGVRVLRHGSMRPSRTPIENPATSAVIRAITHGYGEAPLIMPSLGGSLPNYVFTEILKLPCLTVPYANPDESNHAPNENFEIDRFIKGIRTCAAALSELRALRPVASPAGA